MMPFEPLAIVGQGCVLPGALSPAALWENVLAKKSGVTEVPRDRWGMDPAAMTGPSPDATYSTAGGYVTGFDAVFDPVGFALPEDAITPLDPLFHWVLHAGREALVDAGFGAPVHDRAGRFGLILGNLSFPTESLAAFGEAVFHDELGLETAAKARPDARNRFMSGLPAHLAARALGLSGGAFCLDAACASSLYAIGLAADWLHTRKADVVLAGAVNRADSLFLHVGFCALKALSPTGQSRPFHRGADGLVPAEGAGVVALMRLSDAVAQRKRILGVVRGVGLSNDGRGKNLLAPSSAGQARAMRLAYERAGLAPTSVSLVECHATGTPTGDSTELASMREVFVGAAPRSVRIGSLKSNLGHLITAAGIAGVQKVLGALNHQTLPPTLNLDEPVAALDEESTPFAPVLAPERWEARGDAPRRAAVSAFGFGGNNAHVVLEEWTGEPLPTMHVPGVELPAAEQPTAEPSRPRLALVSLGARVGEGQSKDDLLRQLFGTEALPFTARDVEVDARGVRFPPNDLKEALPQQLLLFEAAREAMSALKKPPHEERTAVLIGMQCDIDVTTPGIRWRLPQRAKEASHAGALELDEASAFDWGRTLRDLVAPPLTAQSVLGQMPNIPANRLNVQLDLRGPGFTLSAEELSGLAALQTAATWLLRGDVDCALVGAVDVCGDPRHQAAVRGVDGEAAPEPGDAAVALVLKRAEDAEADGDAVLAYLDDVSLATKPRDDETQGEASGQLRVVVRGLSEASAPAQGALALDARTGHAHAASGLLAVAAGALACRHRLLPAPSGAAPWLSDGRAQRAIVEVSALGGASGHASLSPPPAPAPAHALVARPCIGRVEAKTRPALLNEIRARLALDDEALAAALAKPAGLEEGARLAVVGRDLSEVRARLEEAAAALARDEAPRGAGIHFGSGARRREREVAFVFGGAASPRPGMGRELLLSFPGIPRTLEARVGDLSRAFGAAWMFGGEAPPSTYLDEMLASSALAHAHAVFSREVLKLSPGAAIGYSLGESNALFALSAWSDLGRMLDDVRTSPLFRDELAGRYRAVRALYAERGFPEAARAEVPWASFVLRAPVREVRRRVADEPLCFLTHINTDDEVVIGGLPEACERVRAALGVQAVPNPSTPAVHCEALRFVEDAYRSLHTRHTRRPEGIRFYGHAHGRAYDVDETACANAIVGQALVTVDFPALVRQAYDDGVRVFVDHGPRGLCAGWIRRVLGDRPHVAIALDQTGRSSLDVAAEAAARLFAAGVPCELAAFDPRPAPAPSAGLSLRLPAHRALPRLPAPPRESRPEAAMPSTPSSSPARQRMLPAPKLPPVLAASPRADARETSTIAEVTQRATPEAAPVAPAPVPPALSHAVAPATPVLEPAPVEGPWAALVEQRQDLGAAHRAFLEAQGAAHAAFLEARLRQTECLAGLVAGTGAPVADVPAVPVAPLHLPTVDVPVDVPVPTPLAAAPLMVEVPTRAPAPRIEPAPAPRVAPAPAPAVTPEKTRPLWDRQDLERLASGRISEVFGPLFSRQDDFPRQVRMPEPPLLLCDRVMRIEAEPGVLKPHQSIYTETDVTWDSWYLHEGRITPGVLIEAGQADLLLISYMGVDFENRGERVYRLLGCDLTYRGELPAVGSVLHYDIHIDGFATHGETRIFFFHSDCRVGGPDGEIVLSVRNGQAGFFTDEELASSGGILWTPADEKSDLSARPLAAPVTLTKKRAFSREDLERWAAGDAFGCFGEGFEMAKTHVRTPRPPKGDMLLLDRVTDLDVTGGPWGRGYLRAELDLFAERWFYQGHFKDDPCMPGTMMFEGCLETLSFYLAAQGFTLDKDGWRFEPVTDEVFALRCRGQAIPSSKQLVYEVFVKEVVGGDEPRVVADILATIDGLKALHCKEVSLRLVPGWPLEAHPELLGDKPKESGWDAVGGVVPKAERTSTHAASMKAAVFDQTSLLATAWGKPSDAFGEMYAPFDGPRRVPRLPGPPYHFMSRVSRVEGPPQGVMKAGGTVSVDYDVPKDAWFFTENPWPAMPFAVLLEVALQPCGWLSSYVGSALTTDKDLFYRNLDGKARVHRHVGPDVGTLTTTTTLTKVSQSGGMIIHDFALEVRAGNDLVFDGVTTFGFFPAAALERQVGIVPSDADKARLAKPCAALDDGTPLPLELRPRPARYFEGSLALPRPMLLMIDRVTGYWPDGGRSGLGLVRAEKTVDKGEWFFKAHFFTDPVQPGSLGVEAMLQTLQWWMLHNGIGRDVPNGVFEPIATGGEIVWKYRGQVIPKNARIEIEVEVLEVKQLEVEGASVRAEAWLWVDGLRIYRADLGMRVVPGAAS